MRRLVVLIAGAGVLSLTAGPALSETRTGGSEYHGQEVEAFSLLKKAARAAHDLSYSGTQYVSSWSPDGEQTSIVTVTHVPGQGSVLDVQPTSAGRDTAVEISETPTVDAGTLRILAQHYDLVRVSDAQCAGRRANVVEVRRPKTETPAARMWLDAATGLVLRREVYDDEGRLARATAFVQVDLRPRSLLPVRKGTVVQPPPARELSDREVERLRDAGWRIPPTLPHGLELYAVRSRTEKGARVLHLAYTDGLSTLSLFVQRGRLESSVVKGWTPVKVGKAKVYAASAMPQRMAWSGGGRVYTVISDTPRGTVRAAIRRFPHAQESPGLLSRIGRGFSRVGSWINPFD